MIASSASVYEDDRHNAISSGFDDFLPKPVKELEFFRVLEKQLEIHWVRIAQPRESAPGVYFATVEDAIKEPGKRTDTARRKSRATLSLCEAW